MKKILSLLAFSAPVFASDCTQCVKIVREPCVTCEPCKPACAVKEVTEYRVEVPVCNTCER